MKQEVFTAIIFFASLPLLAPLTGSYIYNFAYNRAAAGYRRKLFSLEKIIHKLNGVNYEKDMTWKEYAGALCWFHVIGLTALFVLQISQNFLPLNPQTLPGVPWDLALNTAVSFVTNTNWQSYSGEVTLSHFTQMAGLTVQNFLSAATGIAVLFALSRALITRNGRQIGNFWVDITRITVFVLLPISVLMAVTLIYSGTVQTFQNNLVVKTLEGGFQTIPLGPAASQVAIKQLATNGGGFFGANSSFPLENPSAFSNLLQLIAIMLLPSALVFTFGKITNSLRQAWMIFWVMYIFLFLGFLISAYSEFIYNPVLGMSGLMEGKKVRFGIINSVLWSVSTTAASNGSVNAMHSSLSSLSALGALLNIQLGEIIFGGVGSGLYGMLLFVFLTVFITGLMIGRSPEFLGKKIEQYEIKLTITAVLLPGLLILFFSAVSLLVPSAGTAMSYSGPHGFTEILYAFSSAAGNNGSAFAGLQSNTVYYNLTMAAAMIIGRFGVIIPVLAIAGSLVRKNITPFSKGSLPTDNALFAFLLSAVILIVGALTFFPALSLGPLLEHLLMIHNTGV